MCIHNLGRARWTFAFELPLKSAFAKHAVQLDCTENAYCKYSHSIIRLYIKEMLKDTHLLLLLFWYLNTLYSLKQHKM